MRNLRPGNGARPSDHCDQCECTYHADCLGFLSPGDEQGFICPKCTDTLEEITNLRRREHRPPPYVVVQKDPIEFVNHWHTPFSSRRREMAFSENSRGFPPGFSNCSLLSTLRLSFRGPSMRLTTSIPLHGKYSESPRASTAPLFSRRPRRHGRHCPSLLRHRWQKETSFTGTLTPRAKPAR